MDIQLGDVTDFCTLVDLLNDDHLLASMASVKDDSDGKAVAEKGVEGAAEKGVEGAAEKGVEGATSGMSSEMYRGWYTDARSSLSRASGCLGGRGRLLGAADHRTSSHPPTRTMTPPTTAHAAMTAVFCPAIHKTKTSDGGSK